MSITLNISFDTLLETIRNLETSEKQQLWDFLEAELEIDDLDAQEEREVALAYQEYEARDYLTLDQYDGDRLARVEKNPS
jgi:hypothetical protein